MSLGRRSGAPQPPPICWFVSVTTETMDGPFFQSQGRSARTTADRSGGKNLTQGLDKPWRSEPDAMGQNTGGKGINSYLRLRLRPCRPGESNGRPPSSKRRAGREADRGAAPYRVPLDQIRPAGRKETPSPGRERRAALLWRPWRRTRHPGEGSGPVSPKVIPICSQESPAPSAIRPRSDSRSDARAR